MLIKKFDYSKIKKPLEKVTIEGINLLKIKGEKGDPGKDSIVPGPKGDNYILTEKDKKEIAAKIKVPVVEKIVEKTEVRREIPVIQEVDIKNAEEIRKELAALAKKLEDISKSKEDGKGGRIPAVGSGISTKRSVQFLFIDDETPDGIIDGSNADFILKKSPVKGSLKVYRGGARQRIAEDYTLAHKTISFINAPQVGEVILCDYRVT